MKTQATTTTAAKEARTSAKSAEGTKAKIKKSAKAVTTKPTGKASKATKLPATKTAARPDSKKAVILELLRRKQGATIAEIAKVTDWQNHSIRGFLSGQLTKKMGLKLESEKSEAGERTYRIIT